MLSRSRVLVISANHVLMRYLGIATLAALTVASPCRAQVRADSVTALLTQGMRQFLAGQLDSSLMSYRAGLALSRVLGDSALEASALVYLGTVHRTIGQPDSALRYLRSAVPVARAIGNRTVEIAALQFIGAIYDGTGRPDSATSYFRAAVTLSRASGDRLNEAISLAGISKVFSVTGRPDSALSYLRAALPIGREVGSQQFEETILIDIGTLYAGIGQPDSALTYLRAALPLSRAIGDRAGEAAALNNIGAAYREVGQRDSALTYLHAALPLRRTAGDRAAEAMTLNGIGMVYKDLSQPDSALAYFRVAVALTRATGSRRDEAAVLGNIGSVYQLMSQADSALSYFRAALPLSQASGDRNGEAAALNEIGRSYGTDRPDSALTYFRASLRLLRETGNRTGEATTLNNIGVVFSSIGPPDSAIAYYGEALKLKRAVGDRPGEAGLLTNIGEILSRLGQRDSALAYYRTSLRLSRTLVGRENDALTLSNIGWLFRETGRPDSALTYSRAALPLWRTMRNRQGEAETLTNIGLVFHAIGQSDSALAMLDSAIALFATVRVHAGSDAGAVAYAEHQRGAGDMWVRTWLASGMQGGVRERAATATAAALAAAERGRAQGLRDLLARSGRAAGPAATDILWARDTVPGADLTAEAELELAPLRRAGTAVLYYFVGGDDTLTTWLLSPTGALRIAGRVAMPSDSLAALVTGLRAGAGADAARTRMARGEAVEQERVAGRRPPNEGARARGVEDEASAASLARLRAAMSALGALLLPADLARAVPAGTDLVIVPHGVVGLVPFAALTATGDTLPLGARYDLRYAPSLRALGAAEGRTANWTKNDGRALVVGDPAMPTVSATDGRRVQLKDLPAARAEGESVALRFRVSALTSQAATETAVRAALPTAPLIHLATHGLAYGTEARVRDSYVALAPDAKNDGLLTIGEMLDDVPSLAADLVVLSACQTGLGNLKQAEGTVGFQRALLAKGARSVLVSLWSVDDRATALLMRRFYTHWLGPDGRPSRSKAEALRRAQTDVRLTPGFESPRYWAAFQLVGAR